jgi:uncharacterized protein YycO
MDCLPGDIILYAATPTSPFYRRLVGSSELMFKWGTGKIQYGHAAIATGSQTMVEAVWPHVRTNTIDWTDPGIEIWRVTGASTNQGQIAADVATSHVGDWYDIGDAVFGLFPSNHAEICSVLVQDSWLGDSINLAPKPANNIVSPAALAAGGLLTKVYG